MPPGMPAGMPPGLGNMMQNPAMMQQVNNKKEREKAFSCFLVADFLSAHSHSLKSRPLSSYHLEEE